MNKMIQIENISKVFRTTEVETVALNHVNLEVKGGEFVAIMGPSGCGKSTLLNILGLLDNPTEGFLYIVISFQHCVVVRFKEVGAGTKPHHGYTTQHAF